jgi:hypothetical protein
MIFQGCDAGHTESLVRLPILIFHARLLLLSFARELHTHCKNDHTKCPHCQHVHAQRLPWHKQLKTESAISSSVICDPTSDFPVDGFESVARSRTCTTKTN